MFLFALHDKLYITTKYKGHAQMIDVPISNFKWSKTFQIMFNILVERQYLRVWFVAKYMLGPVIKLQENKNKKLS